MTCVNEFLRNILDAINSIVGNYGWSIVVFTFFIRMILLPFDVKSRKGMRKTQSLQPKLAELQKKYKNDKEKLNKKTMELYKKENVSMFSGCLPMLLTMPILFAMFAAMRLIANEQIANQVLQMLATGQAPQLQSWLWVKNLWMPDSPFFSVMQSASSLQQIPADIWNKVYSALDPNILSSLLSTGISFDFTSANVGQTVQSIVAAMQALPVYQAEMATVPGFQNIFFGLSLYQNYNGLFILPILSAVSQLISTKLMPQPTPAAGTPEQGAAGGMNSGFMKWFFPLFSLYICATQNAAFSIYWVTANVIAALQNFFLNKYLDAKDKKELIQKEGVVK